MIKLALGLAVVIALGLGAVSQAHAQGAQVQISQLQCSGDPEVVVVQNVGDAAQEFAGWELQSDPVDTETFDLTVVGGLAPGTSVSVQSGPGAGGVFKWGLEFIFRDDDPTDFVRLVDATGATVQEVACAEAAQATPTPAPTPTATPAPSDVPNGGGPPPVDGSTLPALLVLAGGSTAVLGGLVAATSRFRSRRRRQAVAAEPMPDRVPAPASGTLASTSKPGNRRQSLALGLTLAVVATAVVLIALQRRGE